MLVFYVNLLEVGPLNSGHTGVFGLDPIIL